MVDNAIWRQELAPVMEEIGFALHACQTFEITLCTLLGLLSEHREAAEGQAFVASWDFHSSKTLGALIRALRQQIEIPDKLESFLREGVDARNRLVHHFFRDVGLRLLSPKGRLDAIDAIKLMRSAIQERDRALEPLVDALLRKYGSSTEKLKAQAEMLWDFENLRADPGTDSRQ